MELHYLDLIVYICIWFIAWVVSPDDIKEEMGVLIFLTGWIIFTLVWIIVFVYPIDLNISDLFKNLHWTIKMIP